MRRVMIGFIAMIMCAGYSLGQSNGLPQWKMVMVKRIVGGTEPLKKTKIFTPTKQGIYRLTEMKGQTGRFTDFLLNP